MIWQSDNSGISWITAGMVALCGVFLSMEALLPKQNIDKVRILRLTGEHISKVNQEPGMSSSSYYFFDSNERTLLKWYIDSISDDYIRSNNIIEDLDNFYSSIELKKRDFNEYSCIKYLKEQPVFKNQDSYTNTTNKTKTLTQVFGGLKIICKILAGNLESFFYEEELNTYFLAHFLTGIKRNFMNNISEFVAISFPPHVGQANNLLGKALLANQKIAQERWKKILDCKSTYLYSPEDCLVSEDLDKEFNQITMESTYVIDYSKLKGYFSQRRIEYETLVAKLPPTPTTETAKLVIRHIMARGNLIMANESNMKLLMKMLEGSFMSKEVIKERCSSVNQWTERCRTKNIAAVSIYCNGDSRDTGNDTKALNCTPINIHISYNSTLSPPENIFTYAGKEMGSTPSFAYQVYYWSFYDKALMPRIAV